jgi:ABC-type transport system substrate-binding protein
MFSQTGPIIEGVTMISAILFFARLFFARNLKHSFKKSFFSKHAYKHAHKGLGVFLCFLLLSACTSSKDESKDAENALSNEPKPGGTLIFGRAGDSVGLDPGHETDGESFKVCDNIYDGLVNFEFGSTQVKPALAESWTISEDGKTYTFKLRKGVKFHDGTDFNADAVLFSFQRQFKEDHPFHQVGGSWKYWEAMGMSDIVESVEKTGPYEVVFKLKQPEAPFLANLAMNFASIVSPAAVQKSREDYGQNPVGTGPFKFESWQKNQNIVLSRFEDYWGEKPYLEKVIFKAIPDPSVRLLEFSTGAIHMMDYPNPQDVEVLEKRDDTKILSEPGMNVAYLAMNTEKEPFNKVKVRRAINHAINRDAIIKHVYLDMAIAAKNPIPPTMWGYNEAIEPYEYDVEKAKKLLKEAGVKEGTKTDLWAIPVSRPYNPNGRKMAEVIQADLRKVGLQAEIVSFEWGTYLSKTNQGEHQMALLGWTGDNGDPDNFLFTLLDKTAAKKPAQNIAFYKSDELHEILVKAKRETDREKRAELYKKAQEIIHKDAPWVPIAHGVEVIPMKTFVNGFTQDPTGKRRFHETWLNK